MAFDTKCKIVLDICTSRAFQWHKFFLFGLSLPPILACQTFEKLLP